MTFEYANNTGPHSINLFSTPNDASAVKRRPQAVDEVFVSDVVDLQWEILRWRRVKTSLLRTSERSALKSFLSETLEFRPEQHANR